MVDPEPKFISAVVGEFTTNFPPAPEVIIEASLKSIQSGDMQFDFNPVAAYGLPDKCDNLIIHEVVGAVEYCGTADENDRAYFMQQLLDCKKTPDVHYQIERNMSACVKGGDVELYIVDGHFITDDKALVGCPNCIAWLHA